MDTITQITLGAAVGEALYGKKAGIKAAAWGAFLGTFPDLDTLANPFLDNVGEILYHRSITHSFLFCLLASPFFGWFIHKIHKTIGVGWWRWTKLAFWVFFTHIILDLSTTYGTQIFYPFSNTPHTLDSIFIIDPLYTLPLLLGLITALILQRNSKARSAANLLGLTVSTMYLIWGLAIKPHVNTVFEESFKHQYGYYETLKTVPNGPTTFLWSGYIIKQDTVYQAIYSIFDDNIDLQFTPIPRNSSHIEPYKQDRGVETLLWFSRGFYTVQKEDKMLVFYDLRFGRSDLWLNPGHAEYVWRNEILFDETGKANNFKLSIPSFDTRSAIFNRFWDRIWGN